MEFPVTPGSDVTATIRTPAGEVPQAMLEVRAKVDLIMHVPGVHLPNGIPRPFEGFAMVGGGAGNAVDLLSLAGTCLSIPGALPVPPGPPAGGGDPLPPPPAGDGDPLPPPPADGFDPTVRALPGVQAEVGDGRLTPPPMLMASFLTDLDAYVREVSAFARRRLEFPEHVEIDRDFGTTRYARYLITPFLLCLRRRRDPRCQLVFKCIDSAIQPNMRAVDTLGYYASHPMTLYRLLCMISEFKRLVAYHAYYERHGIIYFLWATNNPLDLETDEVRRALQLLGVSLVVVDHASRTYSVIFNDAVFAGFNFELHVCDLSTEVFEPGQALQPGQTLAWVLGEPRVTGANPALSEGNIFPSVADMTGVSQPATEIVLSMGAAHVTLSSTANSSMGQNSEICAEYLVPPVDPSMPILKRRRIP